MIVVNTPRAIKDYVATIVGRAAWDALDFKQCDSSSTTTVADCVQANYDREKDAYLTEVASHSTFDRMGTLTPTAHIARYEAQAVKLWDDVKAALNGLGYSW
jgi:hypothetical protein